MAIFPKSIEVELDMKNIDEAMEKAESLKRVLNEILELQKKINGRMVIKSSDPFYVQAEQYDEQGNRVVPV